MKKFRIKAYNIKSNKIKNSRPFCFVVLTDLHGVVYGKGNQLLVDAIENQKPDAVLVAGDMLVRTEPKTLKPAIKLLKILAARYPVYYALGNHEFQMLQSTRKDQYLYYESELKKAGVCFLHNERAKLTLEETVFIIHGLELPMEYYHKPCSPKLTRDKMKTLVGCPKDDGYHILIAHNPKYGNAYLNWGADLTVSGHYHGGVLRINEHMGLTCPQYLLLPPFCCGDFHKNGKWMIISAGLGEHTIPVRIHNPRELLVIRVEKPSSHTSGMEERE